MPGSDGLPAQKSKPYGCVNAGLDGCTTVPGMAGMLDVAATKNGRFLYSWGFTRLIAMARDRAPSCQPVSASVPPGGTVSIQLGCTDPDGDALGYAIDSQPSKGVVGTPSADGQITYLAAANATDSDSFTYRGTAFGVTSDAAPVTITITPPATNPTPTPTPTPTSTPTPTLTPLLRARVSFSGVYKKRFSILKKVRVTRLGGGETVTVTCRTKGKGCPPKRALKPVRVKRPGSVTFDKAFSKRRLKVNTVVTVRVTKPGSIGRFAKAVIRKAKAPKVTRLCLPPGASKPSACA